MSRETLAAHQLIPSSGPEREALREKGQFWTPNWVAEAMVGYATQLASNHIFDPAVGAGAFFRAAKTISCSGITFSGTEIDPHALEKARYNGLSDDDLRQVEIKDFVLNPPTGPFKSIVANPPYIRHHRLSNDLKNELRRISAETVGTVLDGRAGLHIYFLIRALSLLDNNGRLAFIMPADTCEGVFSFTLWKWIARTFRLDAVITFAPSASPFPRVDTNPIIFMISKEPPKKDFIWAKCLVGPTNALRTWAISDFEDVDSELIEVHHRDLLEGIHTGLSRPPRKNEPSTMTLGDAARVMRGIATGFNEFFFLTREKAANLGIPDEFLLPAISRTRDVPGNELTIETIEDLDTMGRPTLLFSPDGLPTNEFPPAVQEYLNHGEDLGVHKRSLISTRRPWYKMETRTPPPILFAYLGRRNARFIRNRAGVVPLTGFLCVYPHFNDTESVERLWQVLQHPLTIANLPLVGKSYGGGAIKVEPRFLEKLPISEEVTSSVGFSLHSQKAQTEFW